MATIAEARKWLTGIKTTLERPIDFYRTHYLYWRDLAKKVAGTTLERVKPANVSMEQWRKAIDTALETVSSALIDAPDTVGARLWMLRQIEPSPAGFAPYRAAVPFETLVDWVAAGRAGDEEGKHLRDAPGEIDFGKTDRQIAWRVFHAIRLNKNPALLDAVREFQNVSGDAQVLLVFDAVEIAWQEYFSVQVVEDWVKWVAMVIREP